MDADRRFMRSRILDEQRIAPRLHRRRRSAGSALVLVWCLALSATLVLLAAVVR